MTPVTIAHELERDRLEHRIRRMELVVAALRVRLLRHQALAGSAPAPLHHALEGLKRELDALRHRLAEICAAESDAART